jgi:glutathione synthase/RimK-type ligase-like ATP-grasp enzyme
MIVLWGVPGDGPIREVGAALRARRAPTFLLDQHAIQDTGVEFSVAGSIRGRLRCGDEFLVLEDVAAIYARPYDFRRLPFLKDLGPDSTLWRHAMAVDDALQGWVEATPALVVNRLSAMASNGSKPYQAELIRAAGFDVPDTLVTTDPAAVLEFCEQHGSVIYKSISGVRSIVSRLGAEHRERLKDIANCPTQFQQYIEGVDCRVHVIGDEVFASEIVCAADDYRYAGQQGLEVDVRPVAIDSALADRCVNLAASLDLAVAGIDLRRTPEGRWYCFEVNPSPGFTFYEESTGQKIAEAIARLLLSALS